MVSGDIPQDMHKSQIEHIIQIDGQHTIVSHYLLLAKDFQKNHLVGFIKPKPKPEGNYAKLPCDERDKEAISTIIRTMAENGKFWLLKHKSELTALGDSVRHVHPLKFMEVIFADEYLKSCMIEIFDDYFKRNGFLDGIGETLTAKSRMGDLDRYINDFAKAVHASPDSIRPFFEAMDWEGLMRYLMDN